MTPLWTALTLGLLGSLHCLGMCGPLVASLPLQSSTAGRNAMNVGIYHGARVTAYGLLGVIPGIIGEGLKMTLAQQWISVAIGIIFILSAVMALKGHFRFRIPFLERMTFSVQNLLISLRKNSGTPGLFLMGFLNGLIPCGMVYMALAAALGRSGMWATMTYMMTFGLGTVPIFIVLAVVQYQSAFKLRTYLQKLVPYTLAIVGLIFIWRGIGVEVPMDLSALKEMGWSVMCH